MALDRQLIAQVRRLDEYELRRLLIVVRGLLVHVDGEPAVGKQADPLDGVRYHQEFVRCGKDSCTSCPHGPYWYARWQEDGRSQRRYVGRQLPGEPLEPVIPDDASTR